MVVQTRKVIVFCAIAAIGTLGLIAGGQPTPRRKISAGAIKFSPATNPPKLQGSFRISTSPSTNAIPSNGTGGACLVADLNQFDIPRMSSGQDRKCTKNSDCNEGLRVQDGRATVMQTGKGPAGSGQGTALQSFATNRWIMLLQMCGKRTRNTPPTRRHSIFQNLDTRGSSPRGSVPLWNRFLVPFRGRLDGAWWRV